MERIMIKTFCLDGDSYEVIFVYDVQCERHFGEYPDFEETPRFTVGGHPWVTAMQEGCIHGINKYVQGRQCMDCGSCQYFLREHEQDLIGICSHQKQRKSERHRGTGERIWEDPVSFIE